MPQSPFEASGHLTRYSITSGGQAISDTIQIVSIDITTAINKIPQAEIVALDGDMPEQTFPVSDSDVFKPGAVIAIEAGYDDTLEKIFQGVVVRLGIRIGDDNTSSVVVECRDQSVAMTIGRKNANYVDMTDSDIIAKILGSYSKITSSVDSTETSHKELVQHYCSDWDFAVSRAEVNGMLVLVDQNKVTVQAPQTGGEPDLEVAYGGDLMEFSATIDSRTQLTSVRGVVWDPSNQAVSEATSSPQTLNQQGDLSSSTLASVVGPSEFRLQTPAPLEQSAVQSWTKGQQIKAGLSRIRGRMKFQGSSLAKIGKLIQLKGVGERFNGQVFVSAIHHELRQGNWTTEAQFGMAPEWFAENRDIEAPLASGLLPGVEGLQLGVVMKLDGDPENQNRIQVSIPLLKADTDGVWARLSGFYASKTFGHFFIPEIGDEVVLGYLNDDPSYPVVLGSVYSSSRTPPYSLTAENYTKAIVTQSKLRLIFDDEKKVVTIITPANNEIVVSDDTKSILLQDQNGNKAQLSPSGILLDSPQDIVINAKGKITMSAVANISITAQADVGVTGLNVSNTAQVAFTAKGSASAELSASGQTVVQGALVMIN